MVCARSCALTRKFRVERLRWRFQESEEKRDRSVIDRTGQKSWEERGEDRETDRDRRGDPDALSCFLPRTFKGPMINDWRDDGAVSWEMHSCHPRSKPFFGLIYKTRTSNELQGGEDE